MSRRCPKCKRRELPPRYRVCDECLNGGSAAAPTVTRLEQTPRSGVIIDALRWVEPRSVDLYCGCKVQLGGRWWPTDDHECSEHGPTWVARVTR